METAKREVKCRKWTQKRQGCFPCIQKGFIRVLWTGSVTTLRSQFVPGELEGKKNQLKNHVFGEQGARLEPGQTKIYLWLSEFWRL